MPDRLEGSALAAQFAGARAHPGPALLATLTGLLNGATMVAGAAAIGWTGDHLVLPALGGAAVPARVWWTGTGLILGISAVRWATIVVRGLATGRVQYRAQAETRRAVAHRYLDLTPAWHRRRSPGKLLAYAVSDVDALWSPMQWAYFAAGMVFMLLLALADLFRRDPGLGGVALALVVLVFGLNLLYRRLLAPRARAVQEARGVVAGVAHESVEGDPVVRSLGLQGVEDARFAAGVDRLRTANLRLARIGSVFDPLLELLPTAAVLAVLAVADVSVGTLVGVVYLMLTIAIPLNVISRFLAMLPMSEAGRERVHEVLADPAVRRFGRRRAGAGGPLRVEVRGVTHGVLRDVCLRLEPGTVTAVAGRVGSGKSTLLAIAGGQEPAAAGRVLFDGVDVRELAPGVVPCLVAVVSQDPFLFAESIRDNLCAGRARTDAELWDALRLAAADDVVRGLPDGLDTVVGERGATLSGGQRQRICLARALVRRPRLLVLDDATSALDPRVERQVLDGLAGVGATVLLTTNRPGGTGLADRVVLLRDGRVAAAADPEVDRVA